MQSEMHSLQARLSELEASEAKLNKWESRKPMIHHYLAVVHDMAESVAQVF